MTDPGTFAPSEQPARSVAADPAAPDPTGHPAVDEVIASLAELDGLPVDAHVAVFESAHERLRAVLASGGAPTAPTA